MPKSRGAPEPSDIVDPHLEPRLSRIGPTQTTFLPNCIGHRVSPVDAAGERQVAIVADERTYMGRTGDSGSGQAHPLTQPSIGSSVIQSRRHLRRQ